MGWVTHRRPTAVAAALISALLVCVLAACAAEPFIVFHTPARTSLDTSRSDAGVSDGARPADNRTRYWVATAFLETRNIGRVARVADYFIISAEVGLPTRTVPATFEVPLFLIQDGAVEGSSNVDILKHAPIVQNAREQLSVKLKVKRIPNQDTWKQVRRVVQSLSENPVAKSATDFTVPLALADSASKLIDGMLADAEKTPPSSLTVWLDSHTVDTQADQQVYVIAPAVSIDDPPYRRIMPFSPCANKHEAMCYDGGNYEDTRVGDFLYVTLTFRA